MFSVLQIENTKKDEEINKQKEDHNVVNIHVANNTLNLTPYQLGIWNYQTMYPDDNSYINPSVCIIKNIDFDTIKRKIQNIIERHCSLRSKIINENEPIITFVNSSDIIIHDPEVVTEDSLKTKIDDFIAIKFNLVEDVLCRIKLFSVNDIYYLVFVISY